MTAFPVTCGDMEIIIILSTTHYFSSIQRTIAEAVKLNGLTITAFVDAQVVCILKVVHIISEH